MALAGYDSLRNSENGVEQQVMGEGNRIHSFVMGQLTSRKKQGQGFSVTFDEWTSNRNRRYVNINVHENRVPRTGVLD